MMSWDKCPRVISNVKKCVSEAYYHLAQVLDSTTGCNEGRSSKKEGRVDDFSTASLETGATWNCVDVITGPG